MSSLFTCWRSFVYEHDDLPVFHAAYVVGTLLAATLFHLGFFAILIALHMCLDFVKYHDFHHLPLRQTFKGVLLENITDIALFLTALTFAVYLNHTFYLASLSGLARSEYTLLRMLGTTIPRFRIAQRIIAMLSSLRSYLQSIHPDMALQLSRAHRFSLMIIIVCSFLLLSSGISYHDRINDFLRILSYELRVQL